MKIICPNCQTSYTLSADAIGPEGRKVRCKRCGTVWHAMPEAEAFQPAAAAAADTGANDEADAGDPWVAATADAGGTEAAAAAAGGPSEAELDAALGEGRVIDAVPEGFAEAGEERPRVRMRPRGGTKAAKATLPKGAKSGGQRRPLAPAMAAALSLAALVGLVVAVVVLRQPIVRLQPDLAGLYAAIGLPVNLRGLEIRDVRTFGGNDGAGAVLIVEGTVANVDTGPRDVPVLRFGLRNAAEREIYAWSMEPPKPHLEAGETLSFRSSLPAPPEAAADVFVRFTDRRNAQTRIR